MKTHMERGYGGILCGLVRGWAWRLTTKIPTEVTCKRCLSMMAKDDE